MRDDSGSGEYSLGEATAGAGCPGQASPHGQTEGCSPPLWLPPQAAGRAGSILEGEGGWIQSLSHVPLFATP